MAPKKRTFAELGFVAELAGTYRADFNIREEEKIRHIRGLGQCPEFRGQPAWAKLLGGSR